MHRRQGTEGLIIVEPSTSIRLRNLNSCCSRETKDGCFTEVWGREVPVVSRRACEVLEDPRADHEMGMRLLNDENESLDGIGEEKIAVNEGFED